MQDLVIPSDLTPDMIQRLAGVRTRMTAIPIPSDQLYKLEGEVNIQSRGNAERQVAALFKPPVSKPDVIKSTKHLPRLFPQVRQA